MTLTTEDATRATVEKFLALRIAGDTERLTALFAGATPS
jgi:hypothetical protein